MYANPTDTDSTFAAYLADGIEALSYRWSRDYAITQVSPLTFSVSPDIATSDKRAVILMASIIYKMGNTGLASFRDGDFAYDPTQGRTNPVALDIAELEKIVPAARLASAFTSPLRGYASIFNPESYNYILGITY